MYDLNHPNREIRLANLEKLSSLIKDGQIEPPKPSVFVNNHIHTTYSFSPYSPSKALWMAYQSGLTTAGIMDHDSISGAEEFIAAGKIINMATTIGVECRANFSNTELNGRLINNPDQNSIAYIALHGIPHTKIKTVQEFFIPYNKERNKRNKAMVKKLNRIFSSHNIILDFEKDIASLSMSHEGGSITERHILYALALKIIDTIGKGKVVIDFLKEQLNLDFNHKVTKFLLDPNNEFYPYDLLGVLKGDLVKDFYIPATTECPDISQVVKLAKDVGCILAYAYLGNVEESVTGDKKTQKFEDDYLDELFDVLAKLGFNAITYMPSRNTMEQLVRLKGLCKTYDFFEISGEDINSPRQPFICEALSQPEFSNLLDSTWALIGHEIAATKDLNKGLFSEDIINTFPILEERIQAFKKIGKTLTNTKTGNY